MSYVNANELKVVPRDCVNVVSLRSPAPRGLSQKDDHGHKKGRAPWAQESALIHGHLQAANKVSRNTALLSSAVNKLRLCPASRALTKKTAGFPGFCPLRLSKRSGNY